MSLTEDAQVGPTDEDEQTRRNAEPPHTVSNQNGEEAEEGMRGGTEPPDPAQSN